MSTRHLRVGAAYYRLTWADPDFTIPGVEPWFYVGTNLSPEDDASSVLHYFQDTISYTWCGSLAAPEMMRKHQDIEPCVETSTDADVHRDWLTLDDIIERLEAARGRAATANAVPGGTPRRER